MERPLVVIELSEALARDIAAGGVFVPGCAVALNEECALVVHGQTEEIELLARVVYLDPLTGAGLELVGFSPALREHLAKLFDVWLAEPPAIGDGEPSAAQLEQPPADEPAHGVDELDADASLLEADVSSDVMAFDAGADASADLLDADGSGDTLSFDDEGDVDTSLTEEDEADETTRARALSLHERLRGLTMSQQIKVAQRGDQQERIMLERYYNKNVWEPLLRNPKLTSPEVARIARMGTLPRVLLEVIVNNGAWLQVPEVRRALLSNPRLGTDQILRVLRMLPKHELKLASIQTAYPSTVRDAAKRVLKEQGGDK